MKRKEAFTTLELQEGASLESIKQAYRRLAFALHPDLNPGVPQAAKAFQRLNEAYVLLSQQVKGSSASGGARAGESAEARDKAREEANRAYQKASAGKRTAQDGQQATHKEARQGPETATPGGRRKEDVLADILNDPFAKRVFEDIYRHIQAEQQREPSFSQATPAGKKPPPRSVHIKKTGGPTKGNGFVGSIKGWFRKQIDEEQVLFLPGVSLMPGARVRLDIRHGLGGEVQTVEIILPPDFVPGKLVRLRGMGKRVGNWRGDLYVRIEAQ